jgi:hypothetical protein
MYIMRVLGLLTALVIITAWSAFASPLNPSQATVIKYTCPLQQNTLLVSTREQFTAIDFYLGSAIYINQVADRPLGTYNLHFWCTSKKGVDENGADMGVIVHSDFSKIFFSRFTVERPDKFSIISHHALGFTFISNQFVVRSIVNGFFYFYSWTARFSTLEMV